MTEREKKIAGWTGLGILAGSVILFAVVAAKAVSTLFKLNKALDFYLQEQHSRLEQQKRRRYGIYDED